MQKKKEEPEDHTNKSPVEYLKELNKKFSGKRVIIKQENSEWKGKTGVLLRFVFHKGNWEDPVADVYLDGVEVQFRDKNDFEILTEKRRKNAKS